MRSRRPETAHRPMYARLLRLHHVAPSGFLCFVFLEGALALGVLLALAELVSWWGVLVLPLTVAMMVKLNDAIAGALSRSAHPSLGAPVTGPAVLGAPAVTRPTAPSAPAVTGSTALGASGTTTGRAATTAGMPGEATTRLPGVISREQGAPIMRPWAEEAEAYQQRVRQSASRRYE